MTAWSSCGGPWRSLASELAVALSTTRRLTELERLAGPSAPHHATTQRGSEAAPRTLLRAEPRVGMRAPHRTRFDRIGWRCSHARNWRRVTDRSHSWPPAQHNCPTPAWASGRGAGPVAAGRLSNPTLRLYFACGFSSGLPPPYWKRVLEPSSRTTSYW